MGSDSDSEGVRGAGGRVIEGDPAKRDSSCRGVECKASGKPMSQLPQESRA